jgi:uncharacterized protein (TIRG00374 family)
MRPNPSDAREVSSQPGSPPIDRLRDAPRPVRRAIWGRLLFFSFTAIALYVLWPSLLTVFSAWPDLLTINPGWFVVMLVVELASFVCAWGLQRLALRTTKWFGVATAQLAGNALSRVLPGGSAAGAALQLRMLGQAGISITTAGSGLTATSLIATATLFALPILVIPAVIAGRPVPSGLAQSAWLGAVVFALLVGIGALLVTTDRPLLVVGRAIQGLGNQVKRRAPKRIGLPERLRDERNEIRRALGSSWWKAVLFAAGNWLFDYLALLAALSAVGSRPRPTLVLLAYVGAMVLAMIPITPGGLGFVEAGLTGLLAVAGVSAPDAVLATLAYRLVSYWLPLPAGLVASALHRRRLGEPSRRTGETSSA